MVKHTQNNSSANTDLFDHFMGLELKGLKIFEVSLVSIIQKRIGTFMWKTN